MRPADLPDAKALASNKPHGIRIRYIAGCRCMLCRAASSRYETERAAARKAGDWNGLVQADRARLHIQKLSRAAIGRRTIAEASGVAVTVISDIKRGIKTKIRARTERLLLSVDRSAMSGGRLIPAGSTWKLIDELLGEGFTRKELARRLGYQTKKLQINRNLITGSTAMRVERLYRTVMEGA